MKKKNQNNKLRDLIVNNPRAQDRIDIREIDEQVKKEDKDLEIKNHSFLL